MGHQPAGAFRNPASHQEDDQSYQSSDQEREPPAKPRIDKGRIEQDDRAARPQRCSDPETSVDQKIGPAAQARGNKLLDCRIDGSVLAADAGAGEEPEQHEAPHIPGEAGGSGRRKIDGKRDEKQLLAPQPIGQPAEKEGAEHRSTEVRASCNADLRIAQTQSGALRQLAGKRARQRDFKTVEDPGDAERNNDEDVEASDRQGIKARRNVGLDDHAGLGGGRRNGRLSPRFDGAGQRRMRRIRMGRCLACLNHSDCHPRTESRLLTP